VATVYSFLLQENGDYLLQENGDRIIIDVETTDKFPESPVLRLLYGKDKRNPTRTLDLAETSASSAISLIENGLNVGPGEQTVLYSGPTIRRDGQKRRKSSRGNASFSVTYNLWAGNANELAFLQRKVLRFMEEARWYEEGSQLEPVWLEYRWYDSLVNVGAPVYGQLSHYFRVLDINFPQWPESLHGGALAAGLIESVVMQVTTSPYSEGLRQPALVSSLEPGVDSDVVFRTVFDAGQMSSDFTVMGWAKHYATDYGLFEYTNAAHTTYFRFWMDAEVATITADTGALLSQNASGVLDADDIYHFALVNEAGSGTTVYINGSQLGTGTAYSSFDDGVIYLGGASATVGLTAYTEELDAWRIFDSVISSTDIAQIYANEAQIKSNHTEKIGPPTYCYGAGGTTQDTHATLSAATAGTYENYCVVGNLNGDVSPLLEYTILSISGAAVPEIWLGNKPTNESWDPAKLTFDTGSNADATSFGGFYRQTTGTGDVDHEKTVSSLGTAALNKIIFGEYALLTRLYLTSGDIATLTAKTILGPTTGEWTEFKDDTTYSGNDQFEVIGLGDVSFLFEGFSDRLISEMSAGMIANIPTANTFRVDCWMAIPAPYAYLDNSAAKTISLTKAILVIDKTAYIYDLTNSRIEASVGLAGRLDLVPGKLNYIVGSFGGAGFQVLATDSISVQFFVTPRWALSGGPVA